MEAKAISAPNATFTNIVVSGEMELEDIVSSTINATTAEIEDITATGTITANTLIVNCEPTATIAAISTPSITVSDWIHAGEMELEDITSTGTATFAKAIVDDMNIEDLTAQRAVFDAVYLGGASNNAITTQTEDDKELNDSLETRLSLERSELTTTGKLVNDIDLSGFSGEYSDNHIMSSKAINDLIVKHTESHNLTLNESLTTTLANYRKLDDLTVSQQLPIGTISSVQYPTGQFSFDNIPTASVEYSREIFDAGVHLVGS